MSLFCSFVPLCSVTVFLLLSIIEHVALDYLHFQDFLTMPCNISGVGNASICCLSVCQL